MTTTDQNDDTCTLMLRVDGMECASCSARVERVLSRVDGVESVGVNLATERATIRTRPGVDAAMLESIVRKAGFGAETETADTPRHRDDDGAELAAQKRRMWTAVALTIPIWLLEMVPMAIPPMHHWLMTHVGMQPVRLMLFALGTLVQFGPGRHFYRAGWAALRSGAPSMDTLVMLGTSAAYGYSLVATFAPGVLPDGANNVYFEAAATIIALILAGRYLESVAKGRAGQAIRSLLDLQPPTALVLRNGEPAEVPLAEVRTGESVLIKPGARVPVDGRVLEGRSFVDESAMTGESIPIEKEADSEVVAGTVNGSGALTVEAVRVGAQTALAQIVRMVEDAQGSKPPIQALADRIVRVFVPFVLATATVTFVVWMLIGPDPALTYALVASVSVLIIACPCAMGIATPISVLVGTGRAAELGAFVREGAGLQALAEADTILFDKTGTLTRGKPAVTDLIAMDGTDAEVALRLAGAVERQSEHPIGAALVARAEEIGPLAEATDVQATVGSGIRGTVDGKLVAVGSARMLSELGLSPAADATAQSDVLAAQGKTAIWIVVDGAIAALVAVADPIKESAVDALNALRASGMRLAMVTGDNRRSAEAVAAQLGIEEVHAEVLPAAKADVVRGLQAAGRRVAFVGDGINDAPALALADAGLAMGTGTDVAIEAGDVVLVSGDLAAVNRALGISRATLRNIKQNLFWAFAYNVVLIPVAAGVLFPVNGLLLSPMLAALAMVGSDLFVVGNALRLRGFSA